MRISLLIMLFSLTAIGAFSQIEFAPLTSNSEVAQEFQEKFPKAVQAQNEKSVATTCGLNPEQYDAGGTVYATSGETIVFCLDRFSFDFLDSMACLNCDDLTMGTDITLDLEEYCISYTANAGIEFDYSDTIALEIFESNDTSTLLFPIAIRRAALNLIQPLQIVQGDAAHEICIPDLSLPGSNLSYTDLECNDPALGILYNLDECFTYLSRRFAEDNEVCILVCDDLCVCDTVTYNFQAIKNTFDISTVPFFDDFSYEGPYPSSDFWLDDRVFVNNTLGHESPSIGVATFDGLSERGRAYGGGYGPSDYLTSNYIDLADYDENGNVYLSFFLCPKGNGYYPREQDSIIVEFKLADGTWEQTLGLPGLPFDPGILNPVGFDNTDYFDTTYHQIQLEEDRFFHDDFQFRFYNKCNRIGIQYIWHLDYVKLSQNSNPTTDNFLDVAFTTTPKNLLKDYTSIPYDQFINITDNPFSNSLSYDLFNFSNKKENVSDSPLNIHELISSNLLTNIDFFIDPNEEEENNIPARTRRSTLNSYNDIELQTNLPSDQNSFLIETTQRLNIGNQPDGIQGVFSNDVVSRVTEITDYYAYDDGSAELGFSLLQAEEAVAIEFELFEADELRGFAVAFPRFGQGQAVGDEFVIKVYQGSLATEPIFTSSEMEVIFPDQFQRAVQELTYYRFLDDEGNPMAIDIPAGTTYFALEQQKTEDRIVFGYDINGAEYTSKQWFFLTQSEQWVNPAVPGAIIMRPIFSEENPPATGTVSQSEVLRFLVFPNPSNNMIKVVVPDSDFQFQLFDAYGRVVRAGEMQTTLDQNISVADLENGLYYLHLIDLENGTSGVQKVQVVH